VSEKKAEVILHPIRMRIIQCLISRKQMTAYQLQEELSDIPQATLYRHLRKLKETGILIVSDERPNRGATEKVYTLPEQAAVLTQDDLRHATSEDHLTYFINFAAHLIGEYGRYVQQPDVDLVRDGFSYRQVPLYLTDEENLEMLYALRDVFHKYIENKPDANRRKRIITVIGHPEKM
jgi:DNA-binding transcriptional ArsR family regulator